MGASKLASSQLTAIERVGDMHLPSHFLGVLNCQRNAAHCVHALKGEEKGARSLNEQRTVCLENCYGVRGAPSMLHPTYAKFNIKYI